MSIVLKLISLVESTAFGRYALAVHTVAAGLAFTMLGGPWLKMYFRGGDGYYYRLLSEVSLDFTGNPLFYSAIDPTQGMGISVLPFNPWLSPPFYLVHVIQDPTLRALVPFVLLALFTFLSIYALGRAAKFSKTVTFTAAWLGTLMAVPLAFWSSRLGLYAITYIQIMALGNAALACFYALGRHADHRRNILLGLGAAGFAWWAILFSAADTSVAGVTYSLMAAGYMAGIRQRRELWWKIGLIVAVGATALLVRLDRHFLALSVNAARVVLDKEFEVSTHPSQLITLVRISVISVIGYAAIAAMSVEVATRHARFLRVGLSFALAVIACVAISSIYTAKGGWQLPAPFQFEYYLFPLYALFATQGATRLFMLVGRCAKAGPAASYVTRRRVRVLLVVLLAVWFVDYFRSPIYNFIRRPLPEPWSTTQTDFSRYLKQELAVATGRPWNGAVVSFIGRPGDKTADRMTMPYQEVRPYFGNEHTTFDLRIDGIPTLEGFTPIMSPLFYRFVTDLLTRPDTPRQISAVFVTRFRPNILKAMGVRFLIDDTDAVDPDWRPVKQMTSADGKKTLYLYDLGHPNLGGYSPTRQIIRHSLADSLATMDNPKFDFRTSVVLLEPLNHELVPLESSRLSLGRTGYHLDAKSAGTSMAVLPLQYSACLEWTPDRPEDAGAVRFVAANLVQTGVVFSKAARGTIAFRFGPLSDPACKFQDRAQYDALTGHGDK